MVSIEEVLPPTYSRDLWYVLLSFNVLTLHIESGGSQLCPRCDNLHLFSVFKVDSFYVLCDVLLELELVDLKQ